MLSRISAADLLERPAQGETPAPRPARSAHFAYPVIEHEAAFSLLTQEERVLILLSRSRSRLAALLPSWAAAIEHRLPAFSAESAEARAAGARMTALRRYAILYRLDRSGLAFEEEARMAEAGYSEPQLGAIRFLVESFDRAWSPPRFAWGKSLVFLTLAAAGAWLLQRSIGPAIGDDLLAWLLSILAATAFASFLSVTAHPVGEVRPRR